MLRGQGWEVGRLQDEHDGGRGARAVCFLRELRQMRHRWDHWRCDTEDRPPMAKQCQRDWVLS